MLLFCDQNEKISPNVWIDLGQNYLPKRRQNVCLWRRNNNLVGDLNYRDHLSCLHFNKLLGRALSRGHAIREGVGLMLQVTQAFSPSSACPAAVIAGSILVGGCSSILVLASKVAQVIP